MTNATCVDDNKNVCRWPTRRVSLTDDTRRVSWHLLFLHQVRHDEAVASAVHVVDFDFGVVLQQLAKLRDIHVHAAGVEVVVVHPDGLQGKVALQHVVDVNAEHRQQLAFLRGELRLLVAQKQYLDAKNYATTLCTDGEKATETFSHELFDICILDIMMPKKDGFQVAAEIRAASASVPIIFLTAKNMKEDVLAGFKIGADDYITKPFNMEELLLRIEAVLRRSGISDSEAFTSFKLGGYVFESIKQTLQYNDEDPVKLTTKESELLKLLCMNVNKVLERNYALKQVWDDDNYFNARSMDVYITKLRKLLKSDDSIEILNIHGKGYKLIVSDAD